MFCFFVFFIQYKNEWFWRQKYQKSDFYRNKKVIKIDDINVNEILVPKEEPYGSKNSFKYFIGYSDNDAIRSLCIKLPQMIWYVRSFESNTTMPFNISDKQLLKKYSQILKKVKNLLKTKSDSEPVYGENDKYIKTKIKI